MRRLTPGQFVGTILLVMLAVRLVRPSVPVGLQRTQYTAVVSFVIDGDTIELADRTRVRLLGINAPEIAHHGKPGQPHGPESTIWLRQLLQGQTIRIVEGIENTDRYGRLLAWLYLLDGRLINEMSLQHGHSRLEDRFGLPFDLEAQLRTAEKQAQANRSGLWALPAAKSSIVAKPRSPLRSPHN